MRAIGRADNVLILELLLSTIIGERCSRVIFVAMLIFEVMNRALIEPDTHQGKKTMQDKICDSAEDSSNQPLPFIFHH